MAKRILFVLSIVSLLFTLFALQPQQRADATGSLLLVSLPSDLLLAPGHAINSNRQIILNAQNDIYSERERAFVWQDGTLTEIIDTFPGNPELNYVSATAYAINESGQVAGAALGENERARAFRWENGTMTNLGYYAIPNLLGVEAGFGSAINAGGVVAGSSSALQSSCDFPGDAPYYNCSVSVGTLFDGAPTALEPLTQCEQRCEGEANDINDAGIIVGYDKRADHYDTCCYQAVKWIGTSPTRLETTDEVSSFALAINNNGIIVGRKEYEWQGNTYPMIWDENGGTNIIENRPEYIGGSLSDINDSGQAVGGIYAQATNTLFATLYQNGVIIDLNSFLPADSPWYLNAAHSINENGDIVGYMSPKNDGNHYFPYLLTTPDFIVNTTADYSDDTPDGACDNGNGECSLREAIQESNATLKLDFVVFNIPGGGVPTIQPGATYNITNPIYLDATSQPNTHRVEIDGTNIAGDGFGLGGNAFVFTDNGNTLKGFVINRVNGQSIFLDGGDGNTIQDNLINTDVTGMTLSARTDGGMFAKNSSDNLIANNVVAQGGIYLRQENGTTSNNTIQENYIALNKDGGALTGGRNGIYIEGNNNTLASNVVPYGVSVYGNQNTLQLNFIGTDATGTNALPNTSLALIVEGDGNIIGGAPGLGNVITNAYDFGIKVNAGSDNNQISYNHIGTDVSNTLPLGNGFAGMYFTSGTGNQIRYNTIAKSGLNPDDPEGNYPVYRAGIAIVSDDADGFTIERNYIGTNENGDANLGNAERGIYLDDADNITIQYNVIAGNAFQGIDLSFDADNNVIKNNGIGTDLNGNWNLGNGSFGINLYVSSNNILGAPFEGNLIANNKGAGIRVEYTGSAQNKIQGNRIWNTQPYPSFAYDGEGIVIAGGVDNEIGGTNYGEGNEIFNNQGAGVGIESGGVIFALPTRNFILGNSIYNNGGLGIRFFGQDPEGVNYPAPVIASWTTTPNDGGGGDCCFESFNATAKADTARDARVKKNGAKKKVKAVVTENNSPDERAKSNKGKNKKQTVSAAESVSTQNGTTNITGTLDGAANTTYRIEYFANNACDTSNNGEGETLVGFEYITTDGNGTFDLNATLSVSIPQNVFVTATATDPNNNTSVFSNCKATVQLVVNDNGDAADENVGDGTCLTAGGVCTLRAAIQEANANAAPDTIRFNIPGGSVPTIQPSTELPTISAPVTIDGTTQPEGWVQLDGFESPYGANAADGLEISAGSSTIKGLVINRFQGAGIRLTTNGGNTIIGNRFGTNVDGTAVLDGSASILGEDSSNNFIGGTNSQERNLFAHAIRFSGANGGGNIIQGNYFGTDVTGMTRLQAASVILESPNNTVGGSDFGAGNLLLGGVFITSDGNSVQGNLIGTDVTGMNGLDLGSGIKITDGSNNLIGGDSSAARNVIANVGDAIAIVASADEIADSNQIINNYIGVKINGAEALGNYGAGIVLETPPFTNAQITNTIIRNNIISNSGLGNAEFGDGIRIERGARYTVIQDNKIGTDQNGELDFGNRNAGIYLHDGKNSTIVNNVVSGNREGIVLALQSDNNTVQGNRIGVNANGSSALGNEDIGILIDFSKNNLIGGTSPAQANIIGANGGGSYFEAGIVLHDTQTQGNIIQGNYIGTNPNGANLANTLGILVEKNGFNFGPEGNFIGGTATGAGNIIANNQFEGIVLNSPFNAARGNSIFNNGTLGIDVAANGVDEGLPSIFTAYFENGALEISGGRATSPGGTFGLDVFSNTACDSSGKGEGETYLGSMDIELDDNGIFDATFPANLSNGAQLTLTFTGSGTEEFSECLQLSAPSYVSNAPNCNGNTPCYATLTEAIAQVTRGSVILVQGGTYTENVSINRQVGMYFTGDVTINGSLDMGSAFVKGTSGSLTVTGNVNAQNAHFVHNNGTFVFNGGGAGNNPSLAKNVAESSDSQTQTFTGNAKFYNVVVGANTILDTGASSFRVQGTFTNNGAVQNAPAAQTVNDATTVTFQDALKDVAVALASNGAQGLGDTTVVIARGVSPSACGTQNFPTTSVERTINITPSNQTDVSATLRIYFEASEANGLNLNQLVVYHCNGTTWEQLTGAYTRGTENGLNYIEISGVTSFSPFGIGSGSAPTAATLLTAQAKLHKKGGVVVKWTTGSEFNIIGFNIHRSTKRNGNYRLLNKELKQAKSTGEPNGNRYNFRNKKVKAGKTYFYKIEIVKADGTSEWSEPIKVKVP